MRVLDPAITALNTEFRRYDLSLDNRRKTRNEVVHEAARAMTETGLGIKAATITPEGAGDVGSPNAILRRGINGTVIVRTGRRIPGVNPMMGLHSPISVVRMAVDDAYGAEERREGEGLDEVAYRTEKISRKVCRGVSEFAFIQARKMRAKVFGGPKWTVSHASQGFFEAAQEIYEREAPEIISKNYKGLPRPDEVPDRTGEIEGTRLFGEVITRNYRWDQPYNAEGYIRVLNTYSGHTSLNDASRELLFRDIAGLIDEEYGGRIVKGYLTTLYVAHRL